MEPLDKAICLGVASRSPVQLGSEEVREILPGLGRELRSLVRGDIGGEAITSNPTTQESISHIFVFGASQGNCFWPASNSVYHCEEVGETLGGRSGPTRSTFTWSKLSRGLYLDSGA